MEPLSTSMRVVQNYDVQIHTLTVQHLLLELAGWSSGRKD